MVNPSAPRRQGSCRDPSCATSSWHDDKGHQGTSHDVRPFWGSLCVSQRRLVCLSQGGLNAEPPRYAEIKFSFPTLLGQAMAKVQYDKLEMDSPVLLGQLAGKKNAVNNCSISNATGYTWGQAVLHPSRAVLSICHAQAALSVCPGRGIAFCLPPPPAWGWAGMARSCVRRAVRTAASCGPAHGKAWHTFPSTEPQAMQGRAEMLGNRLLSTAKVE